MAFVKGSCEEFVEVLASKAAVPGGGGASALVGAVGTALGSMVAALTVGKKQYAAVEAEMKELAERAQQIQRELLLLVDRDAEGFEPLAKAYGMPKETAAQQAEKEVVMEAALKEACSVPLAIMGQCGAAIELQQVFAAKGSVLAVSDAGVGALFCKAALQGASLNVFINTKAMKDRVYAEAINKEARNLLAQYEPLADEIYSGVAAELIKE
ncbi:cyclodeaminase/cyclohydrolase family protein [Aminipila butyrica]|uniref:Cyclodeaminase/cyclohydrolase family protein n=1 Tax=Aminipila butyrica TaxID=433296 RepID=A0A858BXT1_9FIRM|nr:cyclodeaminase/cyclohydrolase family protein [Aminipila butyrica]QIB68876.1 cyclodeaminase/cyclohydrolase family protein [Aminipila butyrica]